MSIGEIIKGLRLERRQSLQDVADGIGVRKGYVWQLEQGIIAAPRADSLIALANHFHCSIDTLVGRYDAQAVGALPPDLVRSLSRLTTPELQFIRAVIKEMPKLKLSHATEQSR